MIRTGFSITTNTMPLGIGPETGSSAQRAVEEEADSNTSATTIVPIHAAADLLALARLVLGRLRWPNVDALKPIFSDSTSTTTPRKPARRHRCALA